MNDKTFAIEYLEKCLSEEDIADIETQLLDYGYSLKSYEHDRSVQASLDVLFAQVKVFLSSDVFRDVLIGLAVNAFTDVVHLIYSKMKNRRVTKLQGGKIRQHAPVIHIILGKTRIVVPTDIEEKKFEIFVNKLLEKIPELDPGKKDIATFDDDFNKIVVCSEEEFIRKEAYRRTVYNYIQSNPMCSNNQVSQGTRIPELKVLEAIVGLKSTGHLKIDALPLGNKRDPNSSTFYTVIKTYYNEKDIG